MTTTTAVLSAVSEPLPADADHDVYAAAADDLAEKIRARMAAAGWHPDDTTGTLHLSDADLVTGARVLRAEAVHTAPTEALSPAAVMTVTRRLSDLIGAEPATITGTVQARPTDVARAVFLLAVWAVANVAARVADRFPWAPYAEALHHACTARVYAVYDVVCPRLDRAGRWPLIRRRALDLANAIAYTMPGTRVALVARDLFGRSWTIHATNDTPATHAEAMTRVHVTMTRKGLTGADVAEATDHTLPVARLHTLLTDPTVGTVAPLTGAEVLALATALATPVAAFTFHGTRLTPMAYATRRDRTARLLDAEAENYAAASAGWVPTLRLLRRRVTRGGLA